MRDKFTWTRGSRVNIDPNAAGSRMEQIKRLNGGELRPIDVVDDARSDASPLHNFFEWNDGAAAEKFRQEQAKYLIRSIVVVVESFSNEPKTVRAFLSVSDDEDKRHYISIADARANPDTWKQVLKRALNEAAEWQERYKTLKELDSIRKEIKSTAKRYNVRVAANA